MHFIGLIGNCLAVYNHTVGRPVRTVRGKRDTKPWYPRGRMASNAERRKGLLRLAPEADFRCSWRAERDRGRLFLV